MTELTEFNIFDVLDWVVSNFSGVHANRLNKSTKWLSNATQRLIHHHAQLLRPACRWALDQRSRTKFYELKNKCTNFYEFYDDNPLTHALVFFRQPVIFFIELCCVELCCNPESGSVVSFFRDFRLRRIFQQWIAPKLLDQQKLRMKILG